MFYSMCNRERIQFHNTEQEGKPSDFNNGFPDVLPLQHAHEGSGHVLKAISHMFSALQLSLQ